MLCVYENLVSFNECYVHIGNGKYRDLEQRPSYQFTSMAQPSQPLQGSSRHNSGYFPHNGISTLEEDRKHTTTMQARQSSHPLYDYNKRRPECYVNSSPLPPAKIPSSGTNKDANKPGMYFL